MHAATLLPPALQEPRSEELRVGVLRSVAEIEQVRASWSALQRHPNSDLDFYLMLHRARPEAAPYVVVLYRGSHPEAMLIGRIEDGDIDVRLGYARLFAPKLRILNIVYQGVLGNLSGESSEALISEILAALNRREADAAVFRFLKTDSPLYCAATQSAPIFQRDHCLTPQTHRGMSLPHEVQTLRARFSVKVRKNHRWQANKLLHDYSGNVRVKCFRESSELDQLFRDAEEVAQKTYQRGLGVGFENNQNMRERLAFEAYRGGLRAYVLYVGGRPSAFWIGTVYKETFFSNFMGYDPSLARYSPGTYLLLQVIDGFCVGSERDVNAIDFGLGDAAYKELLGDHEWQEATVYLFGRSPRSIVLNLLRTPVVLLDRALRHALHRTNLLAKVKHAWRERVKRASESRGQ